MERKGKEAGRRSSKSNGKKKWKSTCLHDGINIDAGMQVGGLLGCSIRSRLCFNLFSWAMYVFLPFCGSLLLNVGTDVNKEQKYNVKTKSTDSVVFITLTLADASSPYFLL